MFLSKIWFFLVAVAAAAAMTLALSMPRPAERQTVASEEVRLRRACGVATILMNDNARKRVDLAWKFGRAEAPAGRPRLKLDSIMFSAGKAGKISSDANATAKLALREVLDSFKGNKPNFVIAVDRRGRVIARVGIQEKRYGDYLKGYYAVDDALDGYLRDDVWYLNNTLYRVAASPVVEQRVQQYAGVVILGHEFNKDFSEKLKTSIGADVAFYVKGGATASSNSAQIHKDVATAYEKVAAARAADDKGTAESDCAGKDLESLTITAGDQTFNVRLARLPGEARGQDAFFAVFIDKPMNIGFMGTLSQLTSNDLSFGTFPWIQVSLLFILAVGVGMFLMILEADRPSRRLNKDAVALAQGETNRLEEMRHKGKYGSVARSVNIALDKLERDAKSAKRDLDNILGPAPDAASGTPVPMPPSGPAGPSGAPFKPPPPSEFKFGGGGPSVAPDRVRPPTEDQSGPVAAPGFDLDLPPPPAALAETPLPVQQMPQPSPPARNESIAPPPITMPDMERPPTPVPNPPPPLPPAEKTPPPRPASAPVENKKLFDDDILGVGDSTSEQTVPRSGSDFDDPTVVADPSQHLIDQSAQDDGAEETEFRKVFDEFSALKKQCGENTDSLTFDRFAGKLRKNRDALIAKHGCKSVKFQVYIKDGKAALKATPIKS